MNGWENYIKWKTSFRKKPTLPEYVETIIVEHIRFLNNRGFPLSRTNVIKLAYEYAQTENKDTTFNDDKKIADIVGCKAFLDDILI